jgi:hypothetical protein
LAGFGVIVLICEGYQGIKVTAHRFQIDRTDFSRKGKPKDVRTSEIGTIDLKSSHIATLTATRTLLSA